MREHFDSDKQATDRGAEIKAVMDDPAKWEVSAHENMGWHLTLLCGPISLREYRDTEGNSEYDCMICDGGHVGSGSSHIGGVHAGRFPTPQAAVDASVLKVYETIRGFVELFNDGIREGASPAIQDITTL